MKPAAFDSLSSIDREAHLLAPYAMGSAVSRGRQHPEPEHAFRSPYQRDRDRILHCQAFRRLMQKTQVLTTQTSEHHRTRLTHTLEVAQISRTISRQLGLNEDLTEAIALAHDLGHPPFGHAGETALDACMRECGGFEHNRQGLRVVEVLEHRYPHFRGLNLTWEVRESLAFHCKRPKAEEVQSYRLWPQTFLEAQVVDAADSIAYNAHDVDDALSLGLLEMESLRDLEICRRVFEEVRAQYGVLSNALLQSAMIRALVEWQVNDLLQATSERLTQHQVKDPDAARNIPEAIVGLSSELGQMRAELVRFLFRHVYHHHRVVRMSEKAQRIITALFQELVRVPNLLPAGVVHARPEQAWPLAVADYLACLTDHSAQEEYLRLFQPFRMV